MNRTSGRCDPRARRSKRRNRAVLSLATMALASTLFAISRYEVSGPSMEPTLLNGDRLLVVKFPWPPIGKIIIVRDARSSDDMVKRLRFRRRAKVWVQGDNDKYSTDSRQLGWLPRDSVIGWAVYRYYPPERVGSLLGG
jgi:nickel-type superoxide dismutase maturation protease